MATSARIERAALCDLLVALGPDAPTLCGDWTTRDLAAHLVARERRPDAALGIVIQPLAGHGEDVRRRLAAGDYAGLVAQVRAGPPWWSPLALAPVDRMANTVEFFVHHEDVRRGDEGWRPRTLDDPLEDDLWVVFRRSAKLLTRRSPAGLVLRPDARPEIVAHRAEDGAAPVTVSGPLGELVLFAYGRQAHAAVELDGPADAVAAVRGARFGI
jgi:uncharacterized protein (TIGR03085 family)